MTNADTRALIHRLQIAGLPERLDAAREIQLIVDRLDRFFVGRAIVEPQCPNARLDRIWCGDEGWDVS
jgi:hypothetical protein